MTTPAVQRLELRVAGGGFPLHARGIFGDVRESTQSLTKWLGISRSRGSVGI